MQHTINEQPGAFLNKSQLRGIRIGTNIVAQVARVRTEAERSAMLWLTNYARLLDLPADALSDRLDINATGIREALTDPDADLSGFISAVKTLRASFEAGLKAPRGSVENPFAKSTPFHDGYGPVADTKVRRKIRNALKFALDEVQIAEIVGETREGKTVCAAHDFLSSLDDTVWFTCPAGGTEIDFVRQLGAALGVGLGGTHEKAGRIRAKIEECVGPRRVRRIIVDEGHYLWPTDVKTPPRRIEYLRHLWERFGVAIVILATPQYSASQAAAMEDNPRWAPGQWDGRVQRFHLADKATAGDLEKIARLHAPDFDDDCILELVGTGEVTPGKAGAMVNAIKRARYVAGEEGKSTVTVELIQRAQEQNARNTRIEQLARAPKKQPVALRRAA